MKTTKKIFALIALLAGTQLAIAQTAIGFRAGLNLADVKAP